MTVLDTQVPNVACPCCNYLALEPDQFGSVDWQICPVCFWENDPLQRDKPDYGGGANEASLEEAKRNFALFGACEKCHINCVRAPLPNELAPRPEELN